MHTNLLLLFVVSCFVLAGSTARAARNKGYTGCYALDHQGSVHPERSKKGVGVVVENPEQLWAKKAVVDDTNTKIEAEASAVTAMPRARLDSVAPCTSLKENTPLHREQ